MHFEFQFFFPPSRIENTFYFRKLEFHKNFLPFTVVLE